MSTAVILIAHGSRNPGWRSPFERIADDCSRALGHARVRLAYLEASPPTLADAVADLASLGNTRVRVLPLFLSAGGHVDVDIPRLLDQQRQIHPTIAFDQLPPIGQHPTFYALIAQLAAEAIESDQAETE